MNESPLRKKTCEMFLLQYSGTYYNYRNFNYPNDRLFDTEQIMDLNCAHVYNNVYILDLKTVVATIFGND